MADGLSGLLGFQEAASLPSRKKLFNLIRNVLETEKLDLKGIDSYIEQGVGA